MGPAALGKYIRLIGHVAFSGDRRCGRAPASVRDRGLQPLVMGALRDCVNWFRYRGHGLGPQQGALAQLVARFHGMEKVRSSNLLSSTILTHVPPDLVK